MKTIHRSITSGMSLVCAVALFACGANGTTQAGSKGSKIAPPNSHSHGQSMAEWFKQWYAWGATHNFVPEMMGHVLFPYWDADWGSASGSGTTVDPLIAEGHGDFTVKPGTAFVTPLVDWPLAVLPDDWYGTYLTLADDLVIDGQTVITQEDVDKYYVPPQYYAPPIGGVSAIQGYFIFCRPLAVGVHQVSWTASILPPYNILPPDGSFVPSAVFHWSLTIRVVP